MKKTPIVIFYLLFLLINKNFAEKIPCYIIKNNGDTLRLTIKTILVKERNKITGDFENVPKLDLLQSKIVCFNSKDKKYELYPSQLKEFGFTYNKVAYKFLSRKDDLKVNWPYDQYVFCRVLAEGYLKLFFLEVYYGGSLTGNGCVNYGSNSKNPGSYYVLQKGEGKLFRVRKLFFKDDLAEYLNDCEEISKLISDRELSKNDMEKIVELYNNCQTMGK